MKWDVNLIPDLTNKISIITGGNAGLGLQSAQELVRKGAAVIIACRTISKGEKAIEEIKKKVGESAKLEVLPTDLADYDSVRKFVNSYKHKYGQLDILMNNAGIVNYLPLRTLR